MKKKLFWIVTVLLFLVFAAEDWAFYRPGTKKLDRLNQAIGESKNEVFGRRLSAAQLQTVKDLVSQNMAQKKDDPSGESYVSQSLERLTDLLKEQDIELLSFTPGDVRQEKLYVISPFEMELRCQYHQFGRLLEAIERSSQFIVPMQFKLSVIEKSMLVKFSVEVYLFKKEL